MNEPDRRNPSRLELLVGLALFDAGRVSSAEVRSYRQLGRRLDEQEAGGGTEIRRIRTWYKAFMPDDARNAARRIEALLRLAAVVMAALAVSAGLGAAAWLFRYDGTVPINVLPVLAVFGLLPLLILLFSVGYALWPKKGSRHIPILLWWIERPAQSIIQKAAQDLPASVRQQLTENWLVHFAPAGNYLRKNLQLAGVLYIVAALGWILSQVAFTDLAFAWSSTLEVSGETIYAITNTISAPWRSMVPAAVVDAATVEATRFYRADSIGYQAVSSGQWWKFIIMAMLFYGLLPRVLAWFFFRWWFRITADTATVSSDSSREILGFMEQSLVTVGKHDGNRQVEPVGPAIGDKIAPSAKCIVLTWGLDVTDESGVRNVLSRQVVGMHGIGGLRSLDHDQKAVTDAARASIKHGNCDILILAPLWEAPRLHFEKRMALLEREAPKSRIIILPVIEEDQGRTEADEATWRKRVDDMNLRFGSKRLVFDSRNVIESHRI